MAVFTTKTSKYWYAYTKDRKKVIGRAVKLKTLTDKLGTENVLFSKGKLLTRVSDCTDIISLAFKR